MITLLCDPYWSPSTAPDGCCHLVVSLDTGGATRVDGRPALLKEYYVMPCDVEQSVLDVIGHDGPPLTDHHLIGLSWMRHHIEEIYGPGALPDLVIPPHGVG